RLVRAEDADGRERVDRDVDLSEERRGAGGERLGHEGAVRGEVWRDPARPRRPGDLEQIRAGERLAAADRHVEDARAGERVEARVVERHDGAESLVPPARGARGAHVAPFARFPKRWARTAAVNDSTAPDATRLHRKTTTVVPTLDEFGLKPSFSLRTLPRRGLADASAEARPAVPTPGSSARSFPGSRTGGSAPRSGVVA